MRPLSTRHLVLACLIAAWAMPGLAAAQATQTTQPSSHPDLVVGQHIKVEGRAERTGFRAEEITLRDTDTEAKVEGTIEFVSPDRARLVVMGFNVSVNGDTTLYRGSDLTRSRGLLARGAWVEVKGQWSSNALKATRIRIKDAPEPTEEIEGFIEAVAPAGGFVVLGRQIVPMHGARITDERTGQSSDARLRRDDDDSSARRPLAIGPLVVGGRLEAGFIDEREFDADDPETEQVAVSRLQVLASASMTDRIEAYAKASLSRSHEIGGGQVQDGQLSEAYLLARSLGGAPIDLQVGRQRFRDGREWFFDEYMDAVRVTVRVPHVRFDAAVTEGIFAGPVAERDSNDQRQFIGSMVATMGGVQAAGYFIARDNVARVERPYWVGGTLSGRIGPAFTFWQTVATQRGWDGGDKFAGWAIDGGITHRFDATGNPALTLGYARGSGDSDSADGVNRRFRQTDLEDNQSYYGGLRRLGLYGDLFDPELSNLHVVTAGLAFKPSASLSIEAILHRTWQVVPSRSLPSSNLDGTLTGVDRLLGDEIDFVFTIRTRYGIDIDLAAGAFLHGPAFGSGRRPAFFWRPQIRTYF